MTPGAKLRSLRKRRNLTFSAVQAETSKLAVTRRNNNFAIRSIELSHFEADRAVPTILQLYTLAIVYKVDCQEILDWFSIFFEQEIHLSCSPTTHKAGLLQNTATIDIPIQFDPAMDFTRTCELTRLIQQWGTVPLSFLKTLSQTDFAYGYVGSEDYTMYPLLMPGTFVQIDESKNEVNNGSWQFDYERPIYLTDTEVGFICCWCELAEGRVVPQAHPLSPAAANMVINPPLQVTVVGQIVGIAMRLRPDLTLKQVLKERESRHS